ncbi:uncharacterized protein [Polyergus mexicanus]|uniref:uncharacterized protein n=1 Tax=Polyergus mexicanus TaxID=615972 RepID=UPI0038B661C8
MQATWRTECQWDESLPDNIVEKWEQFQKDLSIAETVLIPRRIIPSETTRNERGVLEFRLLCSKSRVAPIKPTPIPRLELCSAVLLAHLITEVRRNLTVNIDGIQAWTNSQVVLWWIRSDAARWKSFVAHRVAEIVEMLPAKHWNHVKGTENPADIISRGATLCQPNTPSCGGRDRTGCKKKL